MANDSPQLPNPDEAFSPTPLPPNPSGAFSTSPLPPLDEIPEVQLATPRGHPLLAWLLILSVVALIIAMGMIRDPAEKVGGSRQGTQSRLVDVEARYLVGANELTRASGQDMFEQAKTMAHGSAVKQLRFAVMAGELRGPDAALSALDSADLVELPADMKTLPTTLRRLYRSYAGGDFSGNALTSTEQSALERELGWLGQLALTPASSPDTAGRAAVMSSARRTFWGMLIFVLGIVGVGLAGMVGLVLFLVMIRAGAVGSGLGPPGVNGGLYAETFAVWMGLFVVFGIAASLLPVPQAARFMLLAATSLLSLVALAWPVLRGVPWKQVRQEVGLQWPERPVREVLLGLACYASTIPLLALGVLLTLVLVQLQGYLRGGDAPPPAHPIAEVLAKAPWWELVQALFLLSFVAPLVEETMFRGVLYRQLRSATTRLRPVISMLLSATIVSFVFAVIHPQGMAAVPALMSLAYGFNAVREWRGTLLPSMVAHGLNNGIVFVLAILMLSD